MKQIKKIVRELTHAEKLAQIALRAFFGSDDGFNDMTVGARKRSARAIAVFLKKNENSNE